MALFHNKETKKTKNDPKTAAAQRADEQVETFFDAEFREELKNRGRLRFEKAINDNAEALKQDLDKTVAEIDGYIKKELTDKVNAEFTSYQTAMKQAQDTALEALKKSSEDLGNQKQMIADAIQKSVANIEDQPQAVAAAVQKGIASIEEQNQQLVASVQKSVASVEAKQQQLADAIQNYAVQREAALMKAYQENMAKIVEHYIIEAVSDTFDLKAQLPAILAQLEANKAAITEDMKL